jgi:N-glycosylase/DNA lyase
MPSRINVTDFNLAATLECGQAFRWSRAADCWFTGVVGKRVLRLRQTGNLLEGDVDRHYLALDVSLRNITETFPDDPTLREAVHRHWGLRVLRQEPWETLASFIASSTKQIVQIRQIVELLARRFGEPIGSAFSFPSAEVIARATVADLRACKLGFRAAYLHAAARRVADGQLDLAALRRREYQRAREELLKLHGVGEKIANCVLLFSCGHDEAFPVDVWMKRALRRLKPGVDFGPYAGWAQQYLFHAERHP